MLQFRPASIEDAPRIVSSLREPDRLELEALGTGTVEEIVADSLRRSRWSMLAEDERGELVAAFGVCDATLIGGHGLPWFLTTDLVTEHPRRALAASRAWVEAMKADYWTLSGWVWAGHAAAIKHLRWMGFTVDRPQGEFLRYSWGRA